MAQSELELTLQTYIDKVAEVMVNELMENRSFGTGQLANSVRENNKVVETKDGLEGVISMLWYGETVDKGIGRGPGKMPPVRDITAWIRNKSIPKPAELTVDQFAWAIAKKISKTGTNPKAREFIDSSFQLVKTQWGDKAIEQAGAEQIEQQLTLAFQKSTK
jgi:hypothetical protein